jgi:hypothetical protein
MAEPKKKPASKADAHELVAETESGARNPTGAIPKKVLFFVPLIWTLFQLWYASPLPFIFNIFVLNDTEARAIHLAFAIFLSYTAYPTFKSSPRNYIPVQDWVMALVAAFLRILPVLVLRRIGRPSGQPHPARPDRIRRRFDHAAGSHPPRSWPPLDGGGNVFIIYTFFGPHMPDVIAHKGASFRQRDVPLLAFHRGCLRRRPGRFHRHGLHVRPLRRAAGSRRGGQLLYPDRFCRPWSSARRPGQSGRGLLRPDRAGIRLLHRQRGHHRHLHHPPDEKGRLSRRKRPVRWRWPAPPTASSCRRSWGPPPF